MHKYHKCCSELIWPFYGLLQQLWGKTSLISYLRDFSAQVLEIVFSAHFNRFPASYNCMSEKFKNLHISGSSVHKCHKSCSELIWPFYGLLQLYEEKLQKSHISMSSLHKYHKSCSQSHMTVLRLITTVWGKSSKISYLRGVQCTSITNRVLSSFDRFTVFYNCMKKNFKNLISQ